MLAQDADTAASYSFAASHSAPVEMFAVTNALVSAFAAVSCSPSFRAL